MSQNYWSMLRSYNLVMSETMRKCPEIPAKVFRWSRCNNYAWLASRARLTGANFDAMHLYVLAVCSDWVFSFELLMRVARKVSGKMVRLGRSEVAQPAYLDFFGLSMSAPGSSPSRMEELIRLRRDERRRRYVATLLAERDKSGTLVSATRR